MITAAQFRACFPRANSQVVDAWAVALPPEMEAAQINTFHRESAMLASVSNETGALTAFEEATYRYTPYSRVRQVFGSSAPSVDQFNAWCALDRKSFDVNFFNHVYDDANRPAWGRLGNTQPGDGYKFRGMGPGATTGRGNFTWMAGVLNMPELIDNPELVLKPEIGAKICCVFWTRSGCNAMVDDGTQDGFLRAMRKLNAGLSDFSAHVNYWLFIQNILRNGAGTTAPKVIPFDQRRTEVRRMQGLLLAAGFDPKGVDGIVGPNTRAAILHFEEAHGLPGDGIVDPDFLAALGMKQAA